MSIVAWPVRLVAVLGVVILAAALPAAEAGARPQPKHCALSASPQPQTATADEVGMDPQLVAAAVAFAASRNRVSVQVFRHNCRIAVGPRHDQAGNVAWNVFSSAKSVMAMITGLAYGDGKLGLDDPIGKHLPAGLGDAAHRAVTIRQLLTQTSGLLTSVPEEIVTGIFPIDPNTGVQALGTRFVAAPGTVFAYSQRAVDLLSFVVQAAVGEDLQAYAQRKMFGPMGIERSHWFWVRDRAGTTHGYSYLYIPPNDFVKLGLLMANDGLWNGRQILPADFVAQAQAPSPVNRCYGFLFWLAGPGCDEPMGGTPPGTYAMTGTLLQNNFVVPELDLVVSWTGLAGNVSRYGPIGIAQHSAELTHTFFRMLGRSFRDVQVPDPGPYVEPPLNLDVAVWPEILLGTLGIGPGAYPGCSVLECLGKIPAPVYYDWPPGCVLFACLGDDPRTPGIR